MITMFKIFRLIINQKTDEPEGTRPNEVRAC